MEVSNALIGIAITGCSVLSVGIIIVSGTTIATGLCILALMAPVIMLSSEAREG